jgi:hypothetical protein
MILPKFLVHFVLAGTMVSAATVVKLDTTPLDPTKTWYLDFQLVDGDGVVNNTVNLSLISFGGGSGIFPDTTLSDAAGFDSRLYDFTPGSEISFSLSYTTAFAGGFQDTFTWAVLDENYTSIVQEGLLASLVILLDGSSPITFPAIEEYEYVEPVLVGDTAVPEPGTMGLASLGAGLLVCVRRLTGLRAERGRRPVPRF